jgi:hypothetical protein
VDAFVGAGVDASGCDFVEVIAAVDVLRSPADVLRRHVLVAMLGNVQGVIAALVVLPRRLPVALDALPRHLLVALPGNAQKVE